MTVTLYAESVGLRVIGARGRSTGFDYLRICLAISVISWHSFTTSYGNAFAYSVLTGLFRPIIACILPLFFALSGFLVAGSFSRTSTISTFIGLRVLRIAPGLFVEVFLSGFFLGPFLTHVPLQSYFTDTLFLKYLLNVIGYVHFYLPGVFESNPIPRRVNSQLWTVPWELYCYVSIVSLAVLRLIRRRWLCLFIVCSLTLADFFWGLARSPGHFEQQNGVSGDILLLSFLSAVTLFNIRDFVPYRKSLFCVSVLATATLLSIPGGDFFVGYPASYVVIYLGLQQPNKLTITKGADYSYGVYLYGFVIQQTIVSMWPWARHWYINLPITFIVTFAFAAFSWSMVEKPALRLRRFLPAIADSLGRFPSRLPL